MERMNRAIDRKMSEYTNSVDEQQRIDHPWICKKIWSSYTKGPKSILTNSQMPKATTLHGYSCISAKKIVNYLLTLGLEVQFLVGFPENWLVDGKYKCYFIKEVHDQVKEAMTSK